MADKYDLVVVGAGPGGTAAAKVAAEKGLKVLMLERARTPGDKQVSGSFLWRGLCEEIFPGFVNADFHKGQIRLGSYQFEYQLDNDEKRYGLTVGIGADVMRNLMTVFRNETDKWFAEQTVKAGAELKTALATDLIWENKGTENARVKGVITDKGNFEAPATIDASGLNSLLAHRAGLAKWDTNKVQLGMKYVYKLDPEVLRERMQTYFDDDGVEVDPEVTPIMLGLDPDFWGIHALGAPGRDGIVSLVMYQSVREMVRNRGNIHQRAQWYINTPQVKSLIKGGEFIYCNFHMLATADPVGYVKKSYLPGLLLVGDAGGFAQPIDNFGANVAQWQGRMAAELIAEMKAKKDYSEAMFAKYEENWRNSFIGEDETTEFSGFVREGGLDKTMKSLHDAMAFAIAGKFENMSYPSMILGALFRLIPALPALVEAPYVLKKVAEVGVKKAGGLMGLLGMASGK